MDAGTYGSQYIRPRLGGLGWAPKYGGLTFTVPAGYANDADWPSSFSISRAADFTASPTGEGSPRLMVLTQVTAAAQGPDRCGSKPAPGVAPSPDAVIANLRTIPGLVVSQPTDITVGEVSGTWVDVSADKATLVKCPSGDELVEVMTYAGEGYAVGTTGVDRIIFLSLGGLDLVAISLEAPDQATLDAFWTEMLPVLESFHFE
jgi:hypothetical protein